MQDLSRGLLVEDTQSHHGLNEENAPPQCFEYFEEGVS